MDKATESLVNYGALGAIVTILLIGGGWLLKRLIDQQQQFFDQLLKRLDANNEHIAILAAAVREVAGGARK